MPSDLGVAMVILALFDSCPDDACIKPRDIVSSTGFKPNTVQTTLKRLVSKGSLHHVGHGYYARHDVKPPRPKSRVEALEARVLVLEQLVAHYQRMGRL
jgi:hypothetical protein